MKAYVILGVLTFALWFFAFDKPVSVKADSWVALQLTYVTSIRPPTIPVRVLIVSSAWDEHSIWGSACAFPSHSPMLDQNASCEANGDRLYDNCMAGTLGAPLGRQIQSMSGCEAMRHEYLAQGCY